LSLAQLQMHEFSTTLLTLS